MTLKIPRYACSNGSFQDYVCAHEVVFERFCNSQNENDMNYKNYYRMKFLVFVLRRGLFWLSLNYVGSFLE